MSDDQNIPEQKLRVIQIITIALVMGVVMFGLVVVFVLKSLSEPSSGSIISVIGGVAACVMYLMHLIVPELISRKAVQNATVIDVDTLCGIYQSKTIVGLSMLEGAAFLNLVAATMEHGWWSVAIAGGLTFWMLVMFPTRTRVQHWIEIQQSSRA